jgi:hypothetical protein
MAKKKTTAKKTTAKAGRSSKPRAAQSKTHARRPSRAKQSIEHERPNVERPEESEGGAPIEHYRGERTRGTHTGDPGSLNDETLDRDAPYNKTYGTRRAGRGRGPEERDNES